MMQVRQNNMTNLFPTTFNTSDELFAWLRSSEGGNMLVREGEGPYAVIYYDKKRSNMTLPHVQACRTVVWDKTKNAPVCMGPQRGLPFRQAIDDAATGFVTEEFVDGTMINMFHDGALWRLATRTQLDATGSFYGKTPFSELFWGVFNTSGLKPSDLTSGVTYSWVLQHPEERIVVAPPYGIAKITLVESSAPIPVDSPLYKYRPATYALSTLEDVKEFVYAEERRGGAQFQGVVLKVCNKRYKLRTNAYCEARHLRGNQAKRPYLWLERWSEGRLSAYLRLYPEEQCDADAVIGAFKTATQELHDLYLKVYRRKELPLGQAPQKYRKLLWDAHQANVGAYFPLLRQFMNQQDTARKLWLVNYESRYAPAPAPAEETNA